MRIIFALLIIALIVPLAGCDYLSLDDPKVAKLEQQMAKLNERVEALEAANTRLQEEKEKLQAANENLQVNNKEIIKDLNETLAVADSYRETIRKLVPERVQSIYQVDFEHNKLYNQSVTADLSKDTLALVKRLQAAGHKVKVKVEGYSSKAGPAKLNKWFSKERAEGVAHKMFSLGMDSDIVEIIAHGETDDNERKVIVTVEIVP